MSFSHNTLTVVKCYVYMMLRYYFNDRDSSAQGWYSASDINCAFTYDKSECFGCDFCQLQTFQSILFPDMRLSEESRSW